MEQAEQKLQQEPTVQVREAGLHDIMMPDGRTQTFCLVQEVETNNYFMLEAPFVEQEQIGVSPYGNGTMEWADDEAATPQPKRYSHTVVELHLLSDDPDFDPSQYSAGELAAAAASGDLVGKTIVQQQVFLSRADIDQQLLNFGSSPDFFMSDNDCQCPKCEADLTQANAVRREYVSKDNRDSLFATGSYDSETGDFQPSEQPPFSGGRYDLNDDSDTCTYCDHRL